MSFIEIDRLVMHYERGLIQALKGVSLHIAQGELVALMGPSGCGKTTLINILGALDTPTSGKVMVAGTDISRLRDGCRFRSETIGFVFQHHFLIPAMTLLENVEAPMHGGMRHGSERRRRAAFLLNAVGLDGMESRFPNAISGGERQRVAVARALANDPLLVLADEPTGNLDTDTGAHIMAFLRDTCRNTHKTLLVVTHNPDMARYTDRIVRLKDGRIAE